MASYPISTAQGIGTYDSSTGSVTVNGRMYASASQVPAATTTNTTNTGNTTSGGTTTIPAAGEGQSQSHIPMNDPQADAMGQYLTDAVKTAVQAITYNTSTQAPAVPAATGGSDGQQQVIVQQVGPSKAATIATAIAAAVGILAGVVYLGEAAKRHKKGGKHE